MQLSHLIKDRFYGKDFVLLKVHSKMSTVSFSELLKMMESLAILFFITNSPKHTISYKPNNYAYI